MLSKTIQTVADNGGTIEDAFEAYSKTAGARSPRWKGNLTLAKFRRAFGSEFDEAVEQEAQGSAALNPVAAALLDALGIDLSALNSGVQQTQEKPEQSTGRSVKPENVQADPTSGQLYRLVKEGQRVGLTSITIPVHRGPVAELIGKVEAVKSNGNAVKRLLS